MRKVIAKHRFLWPQKPFWLSALAGLLLLGASLIVNYFAGAYATRQASNAVTDLFLDNLPVLNVGPFFIDGAVLVIVFVIAILLWEPKHIPFVFKSVALFIIVRSFFIALTHLGPSPEEVALDLGRLASSLGLDDGLFFSGHTGLPFMLALVFWRQKFFRVFFLAASVFFATITLLGHIHYSIDVFAAFFIAYAIFDLAKKFFRQDFALFNRAE